MLPLDHERLDVDQTAIPFAGVAHRLAGRWPQGRGTLADQLIRAASSIALNIAQGGGEFRSQEKARFCRMARRSATECAAVLDLACAMKLAGEADVGAGRELIGRIVAMLIPMARHHDGAQRRSGAGSGTRHAGPSTATDAATDEGTHADAGADVGREYGKGNGRGEARPGHRGGPP